MQAQLNMQAPDYRQELRAHWFDLRTSLANFRQWRPSLGLSIAFAAFVFILGWFGGFSRGLETQSQADNYMSAFKQSIAARENAEGHTFLYEKFFLQDVDRVVVNYVREQEAPALKKLWAMTAPTYWLMRKYEPQTRESIVRYAERRLALVPSVRPETLREFRDLNPPGLVNNFNQSYFDETARCYSLLLGREITAAQLNPDAYVREAIVGLKRAK